MKIIKLQQTSPEWRNLRLGKITGSSLKDIVTDPEIPKEKIIEQIIELGIVDFKKTDKKENLIALLPHEALDKLVTASIKEADRKIGFYQLVADRLSSGNDMPDESPMERGIRLEPEAIEVFMEETDFVVDRDIGLCVSDENPNIAYSPDGVIITDYKIKEDVEVKCLSSAKHLEAYFTQEIPKEYYAQMIQGFIVNPDLEKRYMVFYDPRIMVKSIHWIELKRSDVTVDIKFYREYQELVLQEVEELVKQLTF